jgi:fengycin family lipopeptide synthetase D
MDNTQIFILDKYNNLLPPGVIGEVAIGGAGVSKGYLNRPDLNAEKFIAFGDAGVIYKTGDLGRFLTDGNIELFGRSDTQIKLRGYRIELGEIESRLSLIDGIREAVVKIHKFSEDDERLVAFLNVPEEFKMTNEEIKVQLSNHLPGYMIPSFFQPSDGFPLTQNGKTDRKALVLKLMEAEKSPETDSSSLSAPQKKIKEIWEDILKIRNISASANFFDIGGNSLLAINLARKISSEFNLPLKALMIFEFPTIISQSQFVTGGKDEDQSQKNVDIDEKARAKKNVSFKRIR